MTSTVATLAASCGCRFAGRQVITANCQEIDRDGWSGIQIHRHATLARRLATPIVERIPDGAYVWHSHNGNVGIVTSHEKIGTGEYYLVKWVGRADAQPVPVIAAWLSVLLTNEDVGALTGSITAMYQHGRIPNEILADLARSLPQPDTFGPDYRAFVLAFHHLVGAVVSERS